MDPWVKKTGNRHLSRAQSVAPGHAGAVLNFYPHFRSRSCSTMHCMSPFSFHYVNRCVLARVGLACGMASKRSAVGLFQSPTPSQGSSEIWGGGGTAAQTFHTMSTYYQ